MQIEGGIEVFGVTNIGNRLLGEACNLDSLKAIFYPEDYKGGLIILPEASPESKTVWEYPYERKPSLPQQGTIHLARDCGLIGFIYPQRYVQDKGAIVPNATFYTDFSPTIYEKTRANRDIQGPRYEWAPKNPLQLTVGGSLPMWVRINVLTTNNNYLVDLTETGLRVQKLEE